MTPSFFAVGLFALSTSTAQAVTLIQPFCTAQSGEVYLHMEELEGGFRLGTQVGSDPAEGASLILAHCQSGQQIKMTSLANKEGFGYWRENARIQEMFASSDTYNFDDMASEFGASNNVEISQIRRDGCICAREVQN